MNVISLLTPTAQVAYLYDDFTVRQGLEKLRAHGYTAIPVLARDGSYVGTVSEGDFLWNLVDRQDNSLRSKEKQPLKSVMRKSFNPPVSVGVSMEELLERSMSQSFVPVVDDRGAFVGIVTRQNIIRRLTTPRVEKEEPPTPVWAEGAAALAGERAMAPTPAGSGTSGKS